MLIENPKNDRGLVFLLMLTGTNRDCTAGLRWAGRPAMSEPEKQLIARPELLAQGAGCTTMSTPSTFDGPDLEATSASSSDHTLKQFKYAVTHVFLPVQLPKSSDYTPENEHSLTRAVCAAAHDYGTHLYGTSEQTQWHRITKMLDSLQASVQSEDMDKDHVISQLRGMQTGGSFAGSPHMSDRADNL